MPLRVTVCGSLLALLEEGGLHLPAPESLPNPELTDLLWRTIHALADLGVYLDSTNRLTTGNSSTLWQDQLRTDYPINPYPEEFPMVSPSTSSAVGATKTCGPT